MKKLLLNFRVRLTLWYTLALAVILAVFSGALALTLDHSLDNRVDDELRNAAAQALANVIVSNGKLLINDDAPAVYESLGQQGFLARAVDDQGHVLLSSGPFQSVPLGELTPGLRGDAFLSKSAMLDDSPPLRLYTESIKIGATHYGYVQVGESLKTVRDTLSQIIFTLAVAAPLALALASASGLFLANRALRPIDRITGAAQNISATNLAERLNLPLPDDELGRLARTFDAMLARLDEAFKRQRQFTADASHELRTPLAIIKGDIGVALNRSRSAGEYQRILGSVEDEVDRLTRMVDDLLLLARADSGQTLIYPEPLELDDLLAVLVEQVQPMVATKQQTVRLTTTGHLTLCADTDKLLRLFLNLLDNAVKYTPPGGLIKVSASIESAEVVVEVADSGPGIAPDQLERIFLRFHRADASRSREQEGSGLGLPIARSIAEAHGGSLEARPNPAGGSVFVVRLPHTTEPLSDEKCAASDSITRQRS